MQTNRLVLPAAVFSVLLFAACRDNAEIRPHAPTLRDSVGANLLTLSVEECTALDAEYVAALEEARVCDPLIRPKQCTVLVPSDLACPCVVYVNPRNTDALQKTRAARKAWDAGACSDNLID